MGIYYELRKLVLRKSTMLLLCVLLCINAVTIIIQYCNSGGGFENGMITPHNSSQKEWGYYLKLCKKYYGELTVEKVTELKNEYEEAAEQIKDGTYSREYDEESNTGYIYGDYSMIQNYFYDPIRDLLHYSDGMDAIVKKLEENIQYYKQYHSVFDKEKDTYIKEKYENRSLNIFYDTNRLQEFLDYHISDLFIMLILMITVLPAFLSEKQNEMGDLLGSIRMGKKCMRADKYLASGIWILSVVFLFLVENMLLFLFVYKVQGLNAPIYLLPSFQLSGLTLRVWQYILMTGACKILSFEILGFVFLAISKKFQRHYQAYIAAIVIIILLLYLAGFFAADETFYTYLYLLSPLSLLDIGKVFARIYPVNLFGHFVERGYLCISIWGIIVAALYMQKGVLLWYWKSREKKKVFLHQK